MKATLTFDLPREEYEYSVSRHALDYLAVLEDFDNWLRAKEKHEGRAWAGEVREKLYEMLGQQGVAIFDQRF